MSHSEKIKRLMDECNKCQYIDFSRWSAAAHELTGCAKEENDIDAEIAGYQEIADSALFSSHFEEAIENTKRAIRLAKKNHLIRREGIACGMLGLLYCKQSNESIAIDYFHHSIRCLKNEKDYISLASVYSNMGILFYNLKEYDKALYCYETSKYYYDMNGKGKKTFQVGMRELIEYVNKTVAYEKLGNLEKAWEFLHKIEKLKDLSAVENMYQYAKIIEVKLLYRSDTLDEFLKKVDDVIDEADRIVYNIEAFGDYIDLFDAFIEIKQYSRAERMINVIRKIGCEMGSNSIMTEIYLRQMKLYECTGDVSGAECMLPLYCDALLQRSDELELMKQANLKSHILLEQEMTLQEEYQNELQLLEQRSTYDALTGLANRFFLNAYAENLVLSGRVKNEKVGVMIIDVDHFKNVNDKYGHLIGDYCLMRVAEMIKSCVGDLFCARFGGDEFFVLSEGIDAEELKKIALNIQNKLADYQAGRAESPIDSPIFVSAGIHVGIPSEEHTATDFLHYADIALYQAKNSGRNSISVSLG